MEFKETTIIVLKKYNDSLLNTTFLKVLSQDSVLTIRLPTRLENYKLAHLINPSLLLGVELVKTKKNWVLKNITSSQPYLELQSYVCHTNLSKILQHVEKFTREDQDVILQDFLMNYVNKNPLKILDITHFESELLFALGFSPQLNHNQNKNILQDLTAVKFVNNLEQAI
jgi:hypothetical protein